MLNYDSTVKLLLTILNANFSAANICDIISFRDVVDSFCLFEIDYD